MPESPVASTTAISSAETPHQDALTAIARMAMLPAAAMTATVLQSACRLVARALDAEEAYVIQAGDPHFVRVGDAGDPAAYEIAQKGYYLVWRELATTPDLTGGLARVDARRIYDPAPLAAGIPATHLGMLLPSDESRSEMLVVRGPWSDGLTDAQVDFATAVRPMLACMLSTLLDTERQQRRREQMNSLGTVAAALMRDQDPATALPAIATALAKASGFEWVLITLVDEAITEVTARVLNQARHVETQAAATSLEADWMRERALGNARHMFKTRRPLLYPDVQATDHERPFTPEFIRFHDISHVLSNAAFPLLSGGRVLGTIDFSAASVHAFPLAEVESLALLAEQAVLAIEWLRLHQNLRDANVALARAATHDALTGLPNRTAFLDRLNRALTTATRSGAMVAVLFFDLDSFKAVNDAFGHDAGDRLLQPVADRLRSGVRTGDLAARLGGDEFTVVLDNVPSEEVALATADRLRVAVQRTLEIAGHPVRPRVSVGVACAVAGAIQAEELMRQADAAMYAVKSGRRPRARGTARSRIVKIA